MYLQIYKEQKTLSTHGKTLSQLLIPMRFPMSPIPNTVVEYINSSRLTIPLCALQKVQDRNRTNILVC